MAEELVTRDRLTAGTRYLTALKDLGFEPDAAMWSVRPDDPGSLELSLFSAYVDRVGTRRMFRTLYDAYHASKTPPELDPWFVGLYSPDQQFYGAVEGFDFAKVETGKGAGFAMSSGVDLALGSQILRIEEPDVVRLVHPTWVYKPLQVRATKPVDLSRRWKRFEQAVAKAA